MYVENCEKTSGDAPLAPVSLSAHMSDDALLAVVWHIKRENANYRRLPALAAYIDRIGAKELTFRRFAKFEQRDRYPRQVASIRLEADGSIKVTGEKRKDCEPTKAETEAIAREVAGADFPKSITASEAQLDMLREKLGRDAVLYPCYDRRANPPGIALVEQRIEKRDGGKACIPWSLWSDGEWRNMEPEDGPVFWKPKERRAHRVGVMIHEGPKKAAAVEALVSDRRKRGQHAFGDVLARYEHWGLYGGAYRAADMRWGELHAENPDEVVYVCDNDYPGKKALEDVSRAYGKTLTGIQFDKRWPEGFDLADPMPQALFTSAGKYIGPRWDNLRKAATWATEVKPKPAGTGRPLIRVKPEFAQEWVHSIKPEVFVHRGWPQDILTTSQFNNQVRPFSNADDTARLLMADNASQSAVIAYRPAKAPGIFAGDDDKTYFNTHIPSPIKAVDGDCAPFLKFMEYLVPDESERHEVMRWCATLIVRPEIKVLYGLLLISEEQGIGKGTLASAIMSPLIGAANVSVPSESEICDSNYNYWAAHKRLAVVHEIYAGHSAKAYNKLKSIITDPTITVYKKYQDSYEIENWIHVLACSNSKRALQLSMDDRRWLVPKLTEQKNADPGYWIELNRWLVEDGGLGQIKHWAEQFIAKHGPVRTGESAPWTAAKREVVQEGYSPGMRMIADLLDDLKAETMADGRPVVTTDNACIEYLISKLHEGRRSDRLESPLTIRKVAKGAGWYVGEERVRITQREPKAFLLATDPLLIRRTAGQLREDARVRFIERLWEPW